MTTHLPLAPGTVWRAKRSTCPFDTIKIIGAAERRFAWIVEVMPDGRHVTMSTEHIRSDYSLAV